MPRRRRTPESLAGAWCAEEALWGEQQRVRLITGPPSIVENAEQIRSIHAVGFATSGEVLLVQNRDSSWTFPGGRLEGGESAHAALERELWEEARARLAPDYVHVAATRIEFVNKVPGRVYRVHPSYLVWVAGQIAALEDVPLRDPANAVIDRKTVSIEEAHALLPSLERRVLAAVLEGRQR